MRVKRTRTDTSVIIDNPSLPYLVITPHDHEGWLKEREFGIGASKCGVLLGCHMYKDDTPYCLWRSKLGLSEPISENWSMRKGHIFENYVAEQFTSQFGFKVITQVSGYDMSADWIAASRSHPFLRVSPDRMFWTDRKSRKLADRGILEIKTSSNLYTPEDLLEGGKCFMWYCQLQYQLHVMNLKHGVLGFLHDDGRDGGEMWFHEVPYNHDFCTSRLIPSIIDFWTNHVLPARSYLTDGCTPQAMQLANVYAPELTKYDNVSTRYPTQVPGKYVVASNDFIDRYSLYLQQKQMIKQLEEQTTQFENEAKLTLLDSEQIVNREGVTLLTYKQNKPSQRLDSKLLQSKFPQVYLECMRETPGARVLKSKQ